MRNRIFTAVPRNRRRSILAATATVLSSIAIGYTPAAAVPGGTFFELDRNAVHDAATTPPYDWAQLQTTCDISTCASGVVAATGIVGDLPGATGDATYFTGGGSKDNNDINQWGNGGNGSPDKNELTNAYAAANRDGSGNLVIYTGADRYDNSGAAEMGFWLFKKTVRTGTGAQAGKFVDENNAAVQHSVGDVLILSDFTNGGAIGEIIIYKWVGSGGDSGGGTLQQVAKSTTADCTAAGVGDDYCATINQSTTPAAPWPYQFKGLGSVASFQPRTFLEGAVNVGKLGLGDCFGSYLAETRTAPEIKGAELKDYALGDFPVCKPSTTMKLNTMTASPAIATTGQSVTFTAYEKNDGTDPLTAPAGGYLQSADCSPWTKTAGDTNSNTVLDPGETWTFTCSTSFSSAGAKTVTVNGHGLDARFGNKDVTFCASADATKICDADEQNSVGVTVINPSTSLAFDSAVPTSRTVHSGQPVVLTFKETNDATGAANELTSPSVTADNGCTPASSNGGNGKNVGDTDADGKLDAGETFTYTCSVNPTADVTVRAIGHGTDAVGRDVTYCAPGTPTTGKFCDADETVTVSLNVINPTTILTGAASAVITMNWYEQNDATQADEVLTSPSVTANNGCSPTSVLNGSGVNVGDSDGDGKLDAGETWTFRCSVTLTGDGSVTVTAVGHGTDATGTEVTACVAPDPTKVCDSGETASKTVTIG
jgi:hypothetical protein